MEGGPSEPGSWGDPGSEPLPRGRGGVQGEAEPADHDEELQKHKHEAKNVLRKIIESGPHADKIISQMGEVGAIDEVLMQVTWDRLATAREDSVRLANARERAVADCLQVIYDRLQAELQMRSSTPAMRLLNDLLTLSEEGGGVEDMLNVMMEAFAGPTGNVLAAVDVFEMSRDIAEKGAEAEPRERVRRADFEAEVQALVEAGEAELAAVAGQEGMEEARAEAEVTMGRMRDMLAIARGLPDYDDDEIDLPGPF